MISECDTANILNGLILNGAIRFECIMRSVSYFQYHVLHFCSRVTLEEYPIKIDLREV